MTQERFLANWGSQARKGTLEFIVMRSLAGKEFYGYELVERLKAECGLQVSDGTVYAILLRLKNEGFVHHRWEHAQTGPARKYYSLTRSGHAVLGSMGDIWADIVRAVEKATRARERKNV